MAGVQGDTAPHHDHDAGVYDDHDTGSCRRCPEDGRVAGIATTTTTALASSPTSSPATTTTLASTKTTDTNTNEVEPTDITVVAASDLGPTSGSTVTPVLIGLVLGAALTGAIGGAWYLGRRSAP